MIKKLQDTVLEENIFGTTTTGLVRKPSHEDIVNKINELVDAYNSLTEKAGKGFGIINSARIDYCVQCGKEHGYDCPLDKEQSQGAGAGPNAEINVTSFDVRVGEQPQQIDVDSLLEEYENLKGGPDMSYNDYIRKHKIVEIIKSALKSALQ